MRDAMLKRIVDGHSEPSVKKNPAPPPKKTEKGKIISAEAEHVPKSPAPIAPKSPVLTAARRVCKKRSAMSPTEAREKPQTTPKKVMFRTSPTSSRCAPEIEPESVGYESPWATTEGTKADGEDNFDVDMAPPMADDLNTLIQI